MSVLVFKLVSFLQGKIKLKTESRENVSPFITIFSLASEQQCTFLVTYR